MRTNAATALILKRLRLRLRPTHRRRAACGGRAGGHVRGVERQGALGHHRRGDRVGSVTERERSGRLELDTAHRERTVSTCGMVLAHG